MTLPRQQHLTSYMPLDKSQVMSGNAGLPCGYSANSLYPASVAGYNNGWSLDASMFDSTPLSTGIHHRRWSEQDIHCRPRERRSDCRIGSAEPQPHSLQVHSPLLSSSFSSPSDHLRPTAFQNSYSRHSGDFDAVPTNWNDWELEQGPLPPINQRSSNGSWPLHLNIAPFDAQAFDNMLFASSDTSSPPYTPPNEGQPIRLNGYSFPQRLSPVPSPSPSPVYHDVKHAPPSSVSRSSSRRGSLDHPGTGKSCSHCHATTTPLWRRDPTTLKPLCNACGLYLQQRNKLRPQELIDADDDGNTSEESDANYVGPECSHCRTHRTSVWRRSKSGEQLCNACGVYARLRGKPRPLSLKRNKIRPRSKHLPK